MKQSRNILLIDDDSLFNFLNREIIKMENFSQTVSCHVNPKLALEELRQSCSLGGKDFPDMIFLDINMPRMDGWEFLAEFEKLPQAMLDKCEVFILSSSIDPADIEKSKNYKTVKDFISKPLTPEILAELSVEDTIENIPALID